jgi:hypothetical protein
LVNIEDEITEQEHKLMEDLISKEGSATSAYLLAVKLCSITVAEEFVDYIINHAPSYKETNSMQPNNAITLYNVAATKERDNREVWHISRDE